MSDLRSFVTLQARLYEFLEKQDEATLQGIVTGTVQLAVHPHGEAQAPAGSGGQQPVVAELRRRTSEHDRHAYLGTLGLTRDQLREVAKELGLERYRSLTKPKLIDLLAGHDPGQTSTRAAEPRSPQPPPPQLVDDAPRDEPRDEPRAAAAEARPSPVARSADTANPHADMAAVAARLRDLDTEEEGAAYLREQGLDRHGLLAVAAELQLTRVDRLKPSELEKRVLKQAIGARRKFAGLRKW
jgi:hypothetical protein